MPQLTYDTKLNFTILNKRISLTEETSCDVVADNFGNICVHIDFDEQWDGVGKTARFIYNDEYKDCVLDANDECIMPSEVVHAGRVSMGVYGADLKTSTPIVITVEQSILSGSHEELPPDPTPGVYEQIMTIMASTETTAGEATQAALDAAEAANNAAETLNDAKDELENGGFITSIEDKHLGAHLGFWIGTQAEYDALDTPPVNCYVIITDDDSYTDLVTRTTALETTTTNMAAKVDKLGHELWTGSASPSSSAPSTAITVTGLSDYLSFIIRVGVSGDTSQPLRQLVFVRQDEDDYGNYKLISSGAFYSVELTCNENTVKDCSYSVLSGGSWALTDPTTIRSIVGQTLLEVE